MVITSIEVQKRNKNRRSVFLDNKYSFSVDEEDVIRLDLYEGKEISEQDIDDINRICNFSKAKRQALNYITYKMRTAYEVQNMLRQKGFDEPVVKDVVDNLIELDYINDCVYAKKYIKDAYHLKKMGAKRIFSELQMKGIDDSIIQAALDNFDYDEKEALMMIIDKKLQRIHCQVDEKELNKLRNSLLRKGYTLRDINDCINECKNINHNNKWKEESN